MKENMTNCSRRVLWIDMAKGYGIIFVIVGHLGIPYIADYIYAFHMPLFFFLSGIVYSVKDNLAIFLKSKIRRIVVPYICLGIPVVLADLYFKSNFDYHGIVRGVEYLIVQERYTSLWYVACLLILNFIMYPLTKYVKNVLASNIIVVSLCLWGILLWRNNISELPWNIDVAFVVLPFFYVGYRLKGILLCNYGKRSFPIRIIMSVVMVCLGALLLLLNTCNMDGEHGRVDFFYSHLNNEFITFLAAFIGILMMVLLSICHVNRFIIYIGENSLLFFAWHQSIVFPILWRLYWFWGITQKATYIGENFIKWLSLVLTLIMITIANEVLKRTSFRFVLGM